MSGGESGIRTHGRGDPYNGFRDRRLKPLSHLSLAGSLQDILGGQAIAPQIQFGLTLLEYQPYYRSDVLRIDDDGIRAVDSLGDL